MDFEEGHMKRKIEIELENGIMKIKVDGNTTLKTIGKFSDEEEKRVYDAMEGRELFIFAHIMDVVCMGSRGEVDLRNTLVKWGKIE